MVSAQPGRIGHELGIEVARRLSSGGDELTVRLDPAHFGQIEVRMHFDESGQLRATVTASQNATLDMLRRDSADLSQSMRDAGIATDAQSFRFENRREGSAGQEPNIPRQGSHMNNRNSDFGEVTAPTASSQQRWRRFDGSGRINLVA